MVFSGDSRLSRADHTASEEDTTYPCGVTLQWLYRGRNIEKGITPDQVDRQDQTDGFVRSAGTWKLNIARQARIREHAEPDSVETLGLADALIDPQSPFPRLQAGNHAAVMARIPTNPSVNLVEVAIVVG